MRLTNLTHLAAGLCLATIPACAAPADAPVPPKAPIEQDRNFSSATPTQQADLVAGGNAFSAALYSELAQTDGNVFVSPISVSLAFGLLYPGAFGETAEEIAETMGYTGDGAATAIGLGNLMSALEIDNPTEKLRIANAVWTASDAAPAPDFQSLVRDQMQAEMRSVDFSKSKQAAKTINDWVAARTNDRIKNLVPESALSRYTRSVLTNAIWFKADWASPFPKEATDPNGVFTRRDGATEKAAVMRQDTRAKYFENAKAQFVELDYSGNNFSLIVALPKKADGIGALEAVIAKGKLTGWMDKLTAAEPTRLDLTMPKVKLKTTETLNQPLNRLGVNRAFSEDAELDGLLASREPLMVDTVIHKTFLEIDEKGTEAAAATAIITVIVTATVETDDPIEFKIDHPYFIAMRHKPTGAILFMGRIETVEQ